LVPGGKETSPGQIFVTTERVIIEWLGLKKEYQDLHYSDIMNVVLKKNIWSSDIIINSRFQGQIVLKAIGKGDAQKIEQIVNEGIRSYRFGYGGPHYDYDERITASEPPRREVGRLMRWSKGRTAVAIPDFVRRQHEIRTGVQVKVTLEEVE
jgi:hypothetical protein